MSDNGIVGQSLEAHNTKQFGSYLYIAEERVIPKLLQCGCAVGLYLSLRQLISKGQIAFYLRNHTSESFVVIILTIEM